MYLNTCSASHWKSWGSLSEIMLGFRIFSVCVRRKILLFIPSQFQDRAEKEQADLIASVEVTELLECNSLNVLHQKYLASPHPEIALNYQNQNHWFRLMYLG